MRYSTLFPVRMRRPEPGFELSLALRLVALAASTLLFAGLLRSVLVGIGPALLDLPTISYIAAHRLKWGTTCMRYVTGLGSEPFLVVLTGACGIALRFRTGSWRWLLLLAVTLFGAMLLNTAAKHAVARPRPAAAWMAVSASGFAFPSGHATESTAVYGLLATLFAKTGTRRRAKLGWLTIGLLIPFLVGVSRVYLGVHWPTDVLAGWALGSAWLAIVLTGLLVGERRAAAVDAAAD
jgi:membrane-associated phospholipid phosphatase